MLTIIIEMPIVYNALKKQVQDRKVLKVVIIVSNIITTAVVAIVERLITEGYWAWSRQSHIYSELYRQQRSE